MFKALSFGVVFYAAIKNWNHVLNTVPAHSKYSEEVCGGSGNGEWMPLGLEVKGKTNRSLGQAVGHPAPKFTLQNSCPPHSQGSPTSKQHKMMQEVAVFEQLS